MASKTGGLLQDQNLNIRFNEASVDWKTNVSKAPSKRGAALAGRTPLGDLSNSLKPSINRATRKQPSTLFSPLIEKEAVTSGIALGATKKKNTSKASSKQQPAGRLMSQKCSAEASVGWKTNVSKAPSKRGAALAGRTPLRDLSNSLKPSMNRATRKQSSTLFSPFIEKEAVTSGIAPDATKKKNTSKASLKQQPADGEELFDIPGEGFSHNHEECIKAQAQLKVMDMNQWLQLMGLEARYDGEQTWTLQAPLTPEAVKHKEAHDNSYSPPIVPELSPEVSVRWRSDYDDSYSPHIIPELKLSPEVSVRWRRDYDDSDSSQSPLTPEYSEKWSGDGWWLDMECDFKLKSPQTDSSPLTPEHSVRGGDGWWLDMESHFKLLKDQLNEAFQHNKLL